MTLPELFYTKATQSVLNEVYENYIYYSYAIGVDNIGHVQFNKSLVSELELINKKVLNKTYKFSRYKLKLLSKGKGKVPREIYIPTIRDRVLLKTMQLFLQEQFSEDLTLPLPQDIIKNIKADLALKNYDTYIKVDIKNFYPSIDKSILLKKVKKRIHDPFFINLLNNSLDPSQKDPLSGVPQGLSTSNILAHIYMLDLDTVLKNEREICYFRFVDDIFILLQNHDKDKIISMLNSEFKQLNLEIHPIQESGSKSRISSIDQGFDYLGYTYSNKELFSVRKSSINNLHNSIVECFTSYRHAPPERKNIEFLIWRLNLKITGCIDDGKAKGWLFFFSQLTDFKVLHELDHFVRKLLKQFSIPLAEQKRVKKFSRTYFEITHKFHDSRYFPNFDKFNSDDQRQILVNVFKITISRQSAEEIDVLFKMKTRKHINKLLMDLRSFS